MVFEHIRKLQQEYTDKFVLADEQRPELHRFKVLLLLVLRKFRRSALMHLLQSSGSMLLG